MVTPLPLIGRPAVLEATDHHAYARFATDPLHGQADTVLGVRRGDALLFRRDGAFGRIAHAIGPVSTVVDLLRDRAAAPVLEEVRWVNLPRLGPAEIPDGWQRHDDWDLRWTDAAPPLHKGHERVVPLDDSPASAAAVNGLLDLALPEAGVRPGHALAPRFHGIWAGPDPAPGRLIACAADRSSGTVGVIGSVAVHPAHRRGGLGTAISAALTRRLLDRYGLVALGVIAGNDDATRVYQRLGYTEVVELTSIRR